MSQLPTTLLASALAGLVASEAVRASGSVAAAATPRRYDFNWGGLLRDPDLAEAGIDLHGDRVVPWARADEVDALFVSAVAEEAHLMRVPVGANRVRFNVFAQATQSGEVEAADDAATFAVTVYRSDGANYFEAAHTATLVPGVAEGTVRVPGPVSVSAASGWWPMGTEPGDDAYYVMVSSTPPSYFSLQRVAASMEWDTRTVAPEPPEPPEEEGPPPDH